MITVRALDAGEEGAFGLADHLAWSERPTPASLARDRLVLDGAQALVAVEDGAIVGTAAALALTMTVPGADLGVAGISAVGVLASHRRRGVFRDLMARQLADLHDGEEVVAALYASESGLYGRFGYGPAADSCRLTLPRAHAALRAGPEASGRVRLVTDPPAALADLAPGYERARGQRPGMVRRSDGWWRWWWSDRETEEPTPPLLAVHEQRGAVDGYVVYHLASSWEAGQPQGRLVVRELVGADPEVERSLWGFCLGVDLATEIDAWHRPPDDLLRAWLVEPRWLGVRLYDGMWVRLVDCARALEGRRYAVADRLVVQLHDAGCPWNAGRIELEGGPDGARCRRTRRSAALELDVADLAASYLGMPRLAWLARAGRVVERVPGAAARADRLLGWPVAAWSAEMF